MNKFIIFAVVALAACASAVPMESESEFESFQAPTDAEEVAKLPNDMAAFTSYCKRSRDHVYDSINKSKTFASTVVSYMINSAETQDRIEKKLAERQREIQERQTQPKNPLEHLLTTFEASRDMLASHFGQRFEAITRKMGMGAPISQERICRLADKYKSEIRAMFDGSKAGIVTWKPALANVEFEMVPCVTAIRVLRVDSFCQLAKETHGEFNKML